MQVPTYVVHAIEVRLLNGTSMAWEANQGVLDYHLTPQLLQITAERTDGSSESTSIPFSQLLSLDVDRSAPTFHEVPDPMLVESTGPDPYEGVEVDPTLRSSGDVTWHEDPLPLEENDG